MQMLKTDMYEYMKMAKTQYITHMEKHVCLTEAK